MEEDLERLGAANAAAVMNMFKKVVADANAQVAEMRKSLDKSVADELAETDTRIREMVDKLQDKGDKALSRVTVSLVGIALAVIVGGVATVQLQTGDKLISLQNQIIAAQSTVQNSSKPLKDALDEVNRVRAELIPEEAKLKNANQQLEHARQDLSTVTKQLEKARSRL